jgi:hypothetical protein
MSILKRAAFAVAGLAIIGVVATAIIIRFSSQSEKVVTDDFQTPAGGFMGKAMFASRLKARMGDLREVYPAFAKFAAAHQDDLPKNLAELRPSLPPKLADLKDDDWELPRRGKMAPLINGNNAANAILLQQRNVPSGRPKIIVYADGHIEYKR